MKVVEHITLLKRYFCRLSSFVMAIGYGLTSVFKNVNNLVLVSSENAQQHSTSDQT